MAIKHRTPADSANSKYPILKINTVQLIKKSNYLNTKIMILLDAMA